MAFPPVREDAGLDHDENKKKVSVSRAVDRGRSYDRNRHGISVFEDSSLALKLAFAVKRDRRRRGVFFKRDIINSRAGGREAAYVEGPPDTRAFGRSPGESLRAFGVCLKKSLFGYGLGK